MDIEKKYELIPSDIEGLFRIKALKDFNDVKNGDIGGYIQSENNLSQLGDCWIYDNAVVRDNAKIYNNAVIRDYARVCDNARIWGDSKILNYGQVYGNAEVCGNAIIRDNTQVYGDAKVCGNAIIRDNAVVRGDARIFDYVIVCDNADVRGEVCICDNARIRGHSVVQHDAVVRGNAQIWGDAIISSDKDYIVFKNWWSSGRYFTWTRSNNMWKVGCFYGTGEELIAKAYKDSEESGREYECIVRYVERILKS